MIHDARWKCRSCGADFQTTSVGTCPYCKSDDISLAGRCMKCGNTFFDDELTYQLCGGCLDRMIEDHAADYVRSNEDVYDEFAFYMHKRISKEEDT